jgi:hypothetical protein
MTQIVLRDAHIILRDFNVAGAKRMFFGTDYRLPERRREE